MLNIYASQSSAFYDKAWHKLSRKAAKLTQVKHNNGLNVTRVRSMMNTIAYKRELAHVREAQNQFNANKKQILGQRLSEIDKQEMTIWRIFGGDERVAERLSAPYQGSRIAIETELGKMGVSWGEMRNLGAASAPATQATEREGEETMSHDSDDASASEWADMK